MTTATDMSGRPYSGLANAFKYRKTRIEGCACRPEPWTDAEVERHQRYAEIEAQRKPKPAPVAVAEAPTTTGNPPPQQLAEAPANGAQDAKATITPEQPPVQKSAPLAKSKQFTRTAGATSKRQAERTALAPPSASPPDAGLFGALFGAQQQQAQYAPKAKRRT